MSRKQPYPMTGSKPPTTADERLAVLERLVRNADNCLADNDALLRDASRVRETFVARLDREERAAAPPPEPVLFGDEKIECERLGGYKRFARARAIAERDGLDLNKPSDRAIAEGRLWEEVATTVAAARCLDEGIYCAEKDTTLRFSEDGQPRTHGELLEHVVRLNPALRGSAPVGRASREPVEALTADGARLLHNEAMKRVASKLRLNLWDDRDRAVCMKAVAESDPGLLRALYFSESQEAPRSPSQERAMTFQEAVTAELQRQDCPPSPENIRRASDFVRKTQPALVLGTGLRGRK
jgi:hypothetical protein